MGRNDSRFGFSLSGTIGYFRSFKYCSLYPR